MFEIKDLLWWELPSWALLIAITLILFKWLGRVAKDLFPDVNPNKEREQSIILARRIAETSHWVTKKEVRSAPEFVVLHFRADGPDQEEFALWFSPHHPDRTAIEELPNFARIAFDFQEAPIKKVEKQDAVAYLRFRQQ